jgi:hypothetical protein
MGVQLTLEEQKLSWMESAKGTAPIMMGYFPYQGMYPQKTMQTPDAS